MSNNAIFVNDTEQPIAIGQSVGKGDLPKSEKRSINGNTPGGEDLADFDFMKAKCKKTFGQEPCLVYPDSVRIDVILQQVAYDWRNILELPYLAYRVEFIKTRSNRTEPAIGTTSKI